MNKRIPSNVFENVVERFGGRIAIEEPGRSIRYDELNRRANLWAHALCAHGAAAEVIVGVHLPSGVDYITALLAIEKAGAAFMPMDVGAPRFRFEAILRAAAPPIIVTSRGLLPDLMARLDAPSNTHRPAWILAVDAVDAPNGASLLRLPDLEEHSIEGRYPDRNLSVVPGADDGSYVLFTSGSTGEPKAIFGRRQGLAHFVHWEQTEFGLDEALRVSQLAPTTFDVSLRDIFVPLLSGGAVCVPSEETRRNAALLLAWLDTSGVTLVHCVPSIFRLLMDEIEARPSRGGLLARLCRFLLAGEALYGRDVQRWMDLMGQRIELVNLYGPSETTLAKLFYRVSARPAQGNVTVPIGQPLPNTAVLILKDGRLCSPGEIGEIHIKTPFRSKGYYKNPEMTAAAFIQSPLVSEPDVIYKTGDLGRLLPDRAVEYVGRLDRQVKVNGVRVELAEIDGAVMRIEGIQQALTVVHRLPNGEEVLVCYYTDRSPVLAPQIQDHLRDYLPPGMIPAHFVRLAAFPLSVNGKIDRRALPKPEDLLYQASGFEPPRGDAEERLAAIFRDVLGLRRVGVTTPFIQLGGRSLDAIRILARVYREFGRELSIDEFFRRPTIREIAPALAHGPSATSAYAPIVPVAPADDYAVSHSERRLWLLDQLIEDFVPYNVSSVQRIRGPLNGEAFRAALEAVVMRHESLRTTFHAAGGEPRQRIHKEPRLELRELDFRGGSDGEARALAWASAEIARPFALDAGPLLRVALLSVDASEPGQPERLLVFSTHHIVCDEWSLLVFVRDLVAIYVAKINGAAPSLPALPIQYKDYSAWHAARVAGGELDAQRDYWRRKLAGDLPRLELPTDRPRPAVQTYEGDRAQLQIAPELVTELRELGRRNDATLFAVLLTATKILLARHANQETIILGTTVPGRGHPDVEHQIGYYSNTVVLRDELRRGDSCLDALRRIKATLTEALEHQDYPFDRLVEELEVRRDLARAPLFDVGVTLVHEEPDAASPMGLSFSPVEVASRASKYDMLFAFIEAGDDLSLSVEFHAGLFSRGRVERMIAELEVLLRSMLRDPEQRLWAAPILPQAELDALARFNDTRRRFPSESTASALFEAAATELASRPAVAWDGGSWTYAELHARVVEIAAQLSREHGLSPGERVGVIMPRDAEWVAVLLGVLKAGGAYVPIDASHPRERAALVLDDAGCGCVVTRAPAAAGRVSITRRREEPAAPIGDSPSRSVAYVIYTSGSTGKPKGVMIEHRGLINMALDLSRAFGITPADRLLQFSSISFDASIAEVFTALLSGACLVLPGEDRIRDPNLLLPFMADQRVTTVYLPPSFLSALDRAPLPTLRALMTMGEAAIPGDALHYASRLRYFNAYGPTETSACATIHEVAAGDDYPSGVPIGRPIANTEILILDDELQPAPIGVRGEICIAGVGLGRGYLDRPELTAAAFVDLPGRPGERVYRTGDIGRFRADGIVEFFGRKDAQVKVRGHRVEPGEIEVALRAHPRIADACVVPWRRGEGALDLAAYVVERPPIDPGPSGAEPPSADALRTYLAERLPPYMVPAAFVAMSSFPMTTAGKIDRGALPPPTAASASAESRVEEPRDDKERAVVEAWQKVLGQARVSVLDDFFALGGDSIKAIRIASLLRERGYRVSVPDVFKHSTAAALAARIERQAKGASEAPAVGDFPATPIQRWFIEERSVEPHHFNQAVLLRAPAPLDDAALARALAAIQSHHDALRSQLRRTDGGPALTIAGDELPISLTTVDLRDATEPAVAIARHAAEIQAGIDLAQGPCLRAALYRLADHDRLLLVVHHLAVDGVSWRILVEDLATAYRQAARSEPIRLPAKTDPFKLWAEAVQRFASSPSVAEELPFWSGIEASERAPIPRPPGAAQNLHGDAATVQMSLSSEDTEALLKRGGAADATRINDLLLTALARAMQRWTGAPRTVLTLEGHGREPLEEPIDVSRTVGWFTSAYPVALEVSGSGSIGDDIQRVKEALRRVPSGGIGYGMLRYIGGAPLRLRPEVSFNYLGQIDGEGGEPFRLAEGEHGPLVSPRAPRDHVLDVSGIVEAGALRMTLEYPGAWYSESAASSLLRSYMDELTAIIAHARDGEGTSLTTSDIDYDGFSASELDTFLKELS